MDDESDLSGSKGRSLISKLKHFNRNRKIKRKNTHKKNSVKYQISKFLPSPLVVENQIVSFEGKNCQGNNLKNYNQRVSAGTLSASANIARIDFNGEYRRPNREIKETAFSYKPTVSKAELEDSGVFVAQKSSYETKKIIDDDEILGSLDDEEEFNFILIGSPNQHKWLEED